MIILIILRMNRMKKREGGRYFLEALQNFFWMYFVSKGSCF